ncbi:hypothetical protein ACFQ1B_00655 [Streptomyces mexicanus]
MVDCHQDPDGSPCTEWAQAGAWPPVFAGLQELLLPVPAGGQLGPWKPTPGLLEQVFQQLPDFRPCPAREARSRCRPMKRYLDRLRVETREEFERRLKRETAKAAKELHRRPVAA